MNSQPPKAQADKLIRDALENLLRFAERSICQHDETFRGGAIWEICDMCGAKWADDEGGKPAFEWPVAIQNARKALAALAAQAEQPVAQEPGQETIARLMRFYGVDSLKALAVEQDMHIEKLQDDLREYQAEADKVGGAAIHKILTNPVKWDAPASKPEQEPIAWAAKHAEGFDYIAEYREAVNEHINEALETEAGVAMSPWNIVPVYGPCPYCNKSPKEHK